MILNDNQLRDIILNNPNKVLLNEAKLRNKKYRMHMYGIMMESYIATIDGFENKPLRELRVKYARNNKDLFARLSRPIDKVFTARGGSTYYNLSEANEKRAMLAAANVRDGYSIKRWIEAFWKPHFLDDPNGIIFMEIGNGIAYPIGKAYPTYKAVTSIYDYLPKGNRLEYIAFDLTRTEKAEYGIKDSDKAFRVVDDAFDYIVIQKNKAIEKVQGLTFPNYFEKVPAILNSDITDPNYDGLRLSVFDDVVSLADEYLLKGSIKITHDFRHAFPKYWEYADNCGTCKGTGSVDAEVCKECNGSGKTLMVNVSRPKVIDWPTSKEEPIVAPDVAGYVEPSKTYHEIATSDLALLEDTMQFTVWGANSRKRFSGLESDGEKTQTATEIIENQQPQHDRLFPISDTAEERIKFVADLMIDLQIQRGYGGSSINLGRRYLTESPDVIWERYVEAKKGGAAVSLLDELYQEFIENKYSGDPVSMDIMLKLMQVEPFVHLTIEQVKNLMPDMEDYLCKLYYGDWLSEITDAEIVQTDIKGLKESLKKYVAGKKPPVDDNGNGDGGGTGIGFKRPSKQAA